MSNENGNKEMAKEPKPPHKPKRGGRTAAKAGGAGYLTGIGVAGHTGPKGGAHESVADGAGARGVPEDPYGTGGGVPMGKPRAGAYHKYIKPKDIAHEES